MLRGLQHELYFDSLEWEFDATIHSALEQTRIEQCCNITVNCLHVAPNTASCFTNRQRSRTTHGLEQLPSFASENLPQQLRGSETDVHLYLR